MAIISIAACLFGISCLSSRSSRSPLLWPSDMRFPPLLCLRTSPSTLRSLRPLPSLSSSCPLHTSLSRPNSSQSQSDLPVDGATDLSHSHFISSASASSDFNPAQTPNAGQDIAHSLTAQWEGKLSPTTSHLFKLIVPLPAPGCQPGQAPTPRPTAFLLHPSQPLSHLSRLISGSLPPPYAHSDISYLALTGSESDVDTHLRNAEKSSDNSSTDVDDYAGRDEGGPLLTERKGEGGRWQEVAWSQSTDLSDFIKQSCLNEKFKIVISPERDRDGAQLKGKETELRELVLQVIIPSFASRTHYIRKRLLSLTKDLDTLNKEKRRIDYAAHKGAQRLAVMALGGGVVYWGTVIRFTFFTDAGWDMMEPVTWATGFAALLGSAAFLIYHNREVSYSSLLDLSITARQRKLYAEAGLDLEKWTEMVAEAKALRREIERIAADYDIEWRGELEGLEKIDNQEGARGGSPKVGLPGVEIGKKKEDVRENVDAKDGSKEGERKEVKEENETKQQEEEGKVETAKIDVDKTIDEASELAEESEGQRSRTKAAERKGEVIDSADDDKGSKTRKGEGQESDSVTKGRAAAKKVINEK
ncbi:hypothetical protein C366_00102 [Cryptococcus neoformans Tu401-1]|nr:hypothetical protein C366_00102 [Cryptococcus neoformans var. grubii Tu401-1]